MGLHDNILYMRFDTKCNVCKKHFEYNPLKRSGRFCCKECRENQKEYDIDNKEMIKEDCSLCGDSFEYSIYENGVFCSSECVKDAVNKINKANYKNCTECGVRFIYNESRRDRDYCSDSCYRHNLSKNKNGDYRVSYKYKKYKKDYNECEVCDNEHNLEVHHLLPVRYNNDYIDDFDNLITVCKRCHMSIDKNRNGLNISDKEQKWRFEEFKKVSKDDRSKMIEKIVNDDESNRDLIKVLLYSKQV